MRIVQLIFPQGYSVSKVLRKSLSRSADMRFVYLNYYKQVTRQEMDTLSFKTVSANKATVRKEWVVVDAEGQSLGRLCAKVAKILRGKYKPNFTPHVDCGDNVIVINADKVVLTGKKWDDRVYLKFSGYPGGQRAFSPRQLQLKPNGSQRLLLKVVKGMLPKNRLGAQILKNLRVFDGPEHNLQAQQPKFVDINTLK